MNKSDLVLLNDNSPTHLNIHGTFSHITLTLWLTVLASQAQWKTEQNLYGGDHFPILIILFATNAVNYVINRTRFNTKLAN